MTARSDWKPATGKAGVDLDRVRQDLVLNLDQLAGFRGNGFRSCRDCGDGVTVEERFFARHHVAAHPAHVLNAQRDRCVERKVDNVSGGHHGLYAGMGFGFGGVDRLDAGMGVWAAQHRTPDHAGHGGVGGKRGAAGDFFGTVRTDRTFADPLVVFGH